MQLASTWISLWLYYCCHLLCGSVSVYFLALQPASAFTVVPVCLFLAFICALMGLCFPCLWVSCGLSSAGSPRCVWKSFALCRVCVHLASLSLALRPYGHDRHALLLRALLYSPPAETRLTVYRRLDILCRADCIFLTTQIVS